VQLLGPLFDTKNNHPKMATRHPRAWHLRELKKSWKSQTLDGHRFASNFIAGVELQTLLKQTE